MLFQARMLLRTNIFTNICLTRRYVARWQYNPKTTATSGSTINSSCQGDSPHSRRTFSRKIKESHPDDCTELFYKKDQILEMYLNNIPYGGTAYELSQQLTLTSIRTPKTWVWLRQLYSLAARRPQCLLSIWFSPDLLNNDNWSSTPHGGRKIHYSTQSNTAGKEKLVCHR